MASKGSTYSQEMPPGVVKHREHLKEQRDGAKARRAKKGRGNGNRYCYNGIKGSWPSVQKPLAVLSGEQG